ncbi:MAG: hypothetical protein IKL41_02885 [Clostridia bacterium]|nr:hypothetical protein [Clostridia bacterium]
MKKFLLSVISLIMVIVTLVPTVFAANEELAEWQDLILTEEEFNSILANNTIHTVDEDTRATGLIAAYALAISKSGTNTLYIAGKTTGTHEVVKSGFKEVVVQRRANSSSSWSDYATYEDLYWDEIAYVLSKSLTVPTGYQYRVTCVHYAKKNFFSVQKIDNVSNILTF